MFNVSVDGKYLGSIEFGSLDADGQYEQDDEEIIDEVCAAFNLPADITAMVV